MFGAFYFAQLWFGGVPYKAVAPPPAGGNPVGSAGFGQCYFAGLWFAASPVVSHAPAPSLRKQGWPFRDNLSVSAMTLAQMNRDLEIARDDDEVMELAHLWLNRN